MKVKHTRKSLAEFLNGRRHLFLTDSFILLTLSGCLEILPRQTASKEIHKDVTKRFHVIPSTLFYTTTEHWLLVQAQTLVIQLPWKIWRKLWNFLTVLQTFIQLSPLMLIVHCHTHSIIFFKPTVSSSPSVIPSGSQVPQIKHLGFYLLTYLLTYLIRRTALQHTHKRDDD